MIIAITGGTGFIGRELLNRHLQSGDTVRLLTRGKRKESTIPKIVATYHADLISCHYNELISFFEGVDIFYHCAGELSDTSSMYALHVLGTQKLLQAAKKRVGRWVQLSSVGVYGPQKRGIITEQTPLNPNGSYEKTKMESDFLVMNAAKLGEINCSILRPSNVFGSAMPNTSLSKLIKMVQKGFFFFIGSPGAIVNYIHVKNVAHALFLCGTSSQAKGKTFNLSDHCTVEQFIQTIAQTLEINSPQSRLPENLSRFIARLFKLMPRFPLTESRIDALTNRCIYSNKSIEEELGYQHPISIEDGLKELVQGLIGK